MIVSQEKPIATAAGSSSHDKMGVRENRRRSIPSSKHEIALLTAGIDKPYVLGIVEALAANEVSIDLVGSDDLLCPELLNNSKVNFLNLRGNQRCDASFINKALRVLVYYVRLVCYAATAKPKIFHILWNNRFELFDRTLLMLFYKLLGKKILLTAHNVNARARDGGDSLLNRVTLKFQYHQCSCIFVHTERMKKELIENFHVQDCRISLIPFGINNTVPNTDLSTAGAKRRLGLNDHEWTMLFFGRIVPYKGLHYLIEALGKLADKCPDLRLIIAGATNEDRNYWEQIQQTITRTGIRGRIIQKIQFIPDEETELFFKAADVLVLPYTHIFQSGVLFLGYSFGLPVIAADVGALKEEIVEGTTGFICPSKDPAALASTIETFFFSDLYKDLASRRRQIREHSNERYSWSKVAAITVKVYSQLFENRVLVRNQFNYRVPDSD